MNKSNARFLLLIFSALVFASCSQRYKTTVQTKTALGTVCSINAYEDASAVLYDELFFRLEQIDGRFSTTIKSSDISAVNAAAGKNAVCVHDDVFFVIQQALEFAEKSDGVFDPTIGPLVLLWDISLQAGQASPHQIPAEEKIQNAKALVDYRKVKLLPGNYVFLEDEGMSLDLGAIAKGYAADEMVRILREHGVKRAVINLGGNVYVYGKKSDNSPWQVGIKNPFDSEGDPLLVVALASEASVVTSGAYERNFIQDGILYHHIINPFTGFPCEVKCQSVTIVSASSLEADALSTIAFILGKDDFYANPAFKDVCSVFIQNDKSVWHSDGLNVSEFR